MDIPAEMIHKVESEIRKLNTEIEKKMAERDCLVKLSFELELIKDKKKKG